MEETLLEEATALTSSNRRAFFSGKYLIQAPEQIWTLQGKMPTFPTLQPVQHYKVIVFAAVTRPSFA